MTAVLFDARWSGPHGIGRFSAEVRRRLGPGVIDLTGAHPVSARGLLEGEVKPHMLGLQERSTTFFSPGYTPCLTWRGLTAFTVHDLIHLDVPTEMSRTKDAYYTRVVRPAVRRADTVVLTVSEFSRQWIAEWAGVDPARIIPVGNGVDEAFSPHGRRVERVRPYFLSLGNTKPHKNLNRLLAAVADIADVELVLSGAPDQELVEQARALNLQDRLVFLSGIPEADLAAWVRGASAVAIPSLYEGFGLPALEGMASGVPVVASSGGALEEVVGNAGILVDPTDVDAIRDGLSRALTDDEVRTRLAVSGPRRAQAFRWDGVGRRVRDALGLASSVEQLVNPLSDPLPSVTIAHDYLTQRGGAERVVLNLMDAFPDAPIVTSLHNPSTTYPEFADRRVITSPLNRIPLLRSRFRLGLPLFGWAFDHTAIPASTDVVVASTTGFAHGIRMPSTARKLVYCHSPARFLYLEDDYLGGPWWKMPSGWALRAMRPFLIRWDRRAAASADRYLCNSSTVKRRIKDVYGIDATVVHPPHGLDPSATPDPIDELAGWRDYFLVVSRLMPYKNVDVVLETFRSLPEERLVVIGRGPLTQQLRRTATANVRFLEGLSDAQMRWAYAHSRAVIAPSREDYGLTPVEGFSFGKPCLALRAGGYLDTVVEGVTGWFFDEATAPALRAAVSVLDGAPLDRQEILEHADRFSPEAFSLRIRTAVEDLMTMESR